MKFKYLIENIAPWERSFFSEIVKKNLKPNLWENSHKANQPVWKSWNKKSAYTSWNTNIIEYKNYQIHYLPASRPEKLYRENA